MQRPILRALVFAATLLFALSALALLSARPISAQGSNTTITDCTEANFDAALQAAQANGGGGAITFRCPVPTTLLLNTQKVITAPVTIQSSGALTMTGGFIRRHFVVDGVSSALTLTHLALVDGRSQGGGAVEVNGGAFAAMDVFFRGNVAAVTGGGALSATDARIHLTRTTFAQNHGFGGGAVHAIRSSVIISESRFIENTSEIGSRNLGGGLWLQQASELRIESSDFISNTNGYVGGALVIEGGNAGVLKNLHFENNRSALGAGLVLMGAQAIQGSGLDFVNNKGLAGSGIYASGSSANLTDTNLISNSAQEWGGALVVGGGSIRLVGGTLSGNDAESGGAAYVGEGGELHVERSTFSGNTAASGGALFLTDDGHVVLTNTTVSGNTASGKQGHAVAINSANSASLEATHATIADNGVALQDDSWTIWMSGTAQLEMRSSVLANGSSANCLIAGAPLLANVIATDNSCGASGVTVVADAMLGDLADNGGATQTHLPAPTSPVVDAAPCLAAVPTDQRGAQRSAPPALCEAGAIERIDGEEPPSTLDFAPVLLADGPQTVGVNLGVLSTSDIDPADRFTYTILSSSAPFAIAGGANVLTATLQVASAPLPRGVYAFSAQSVDRAGNAMTDTFTITVLNAVPTTPLFTPASPELQGTQPAGSLLGTLAATDADGDALTFSTANTLFAIAGDQLKVGGAAIAKGIYSIPVTVSDGHGGVNQATIALTIVNSAPSAVTFTPSAPLFFGTAPAGAVVTTLATEDADEGDSATFSLVQQGGPSVAGGTGDALFAIGGAQGDQLLVAAENGLARGIYFATVRATDSSGASVAGTISVAVALENGFFLTPVLTKIGE